MSGGVQARQFEPTIVPCQVRGLQERGLQCRQWNAWLSSRVGRNNLRRLSGSLIRIPSSVQEYEASWRAAVSSWQLKLRIPLMQLSARKAAPPLGL
jgi:hypothetical protein